MSISPVIPIYNRTETSFERGEGAYLFTKDGTRYLDFLSGIAVNALGHCHPHLVKELQDQAAKLWHVSNIFSIDSLTKLSNRLVEHTFADSVFFCNSGTEAIEAGIKATRKYFSEKGEPQKHRIITFKGAFHGRTFGAMAATGTDKMLDGYEPRLEGFDKVEVDLDAVRKAITPNTAAILVEPVQGEGGISPKPLKLLPELRKICDEHGILLFLDEVQCGVGRTGTLFAHEHSGVTPDIMSIAKGIGGGFPLGACLMVEKVAKAMKVGSHGTTFGGNPLATTVGNAVLDIILAEGFLDKVNKSAASLKAALETLQNKHPKMVEEIRGTGLMLGIKLKAEYDPAKVVVALRENKLLVNTAGENVVRILPPLIIDESHIEEGISIIDKTLSEVANG